MIMIDNMNLNDQILEERKKCFSKTFDSKELKDFLLKSFEISDEVSLRFGIPKDPSQTYYIKDDRLYINEIFSPFIIQILKNEGFNLYEVYNCIYVKLNFKNENL